MDDRTEKRCPVPGTHSKLAQAHRLWHQTLDTYGDPDGFTTFLNTTLQALRNVSFTLQSEKAGIPNFEDWYGGWQEQMRADPIMRWLVEARNHVTKKSDLETRSTARVSVRYSWTSELAFEIEVPPLASPEAIAVSLRDIPVPDEHREDALLTIERCWIAETLPDFELLDALAYGYGVLAQLLEDAHAQVGLKMGVIEDDPTHMRRFDAAHLAGRLPCMVATSELRSAHLDLSTGGLTWVTSAAMKPEKNIDELRERYGEPDEPTPQDSAGLFEGSEYWLRHAMRALETDGHHLTMAMLLGPNGLDMQAMGPADRQGQLLFMNGVADTVSRTGATEVILIAEAWIAPASPDPANKVRARDRADRQEALTLAVATADRRTRQWIVAFDRTPDGAIRFGTPNSSDAGQPLALESVLNVWGYSVRDLGDPTDV